jgi:hypothetical protein
MLTSPTFAQEHAMAPTETRPAADDETPESDAGRVPPTPDEDGPHDVPDDTVIEKTLPTKSR